MSGDFEDLWPSLAHDALGEIFFDARPIFVASADGRRVLYANSAGRRHLHLTASAPLEDARLDDRLSDRLVRFASRGTAPGETRELLRTMEGLKASLESLIFHRLVESGPVVVTVETTAVDAMDARPDLNLASLVREGGLVALFAHDGDVVAARGEHSAVEGLEDAVDALLDESDGASVVARTLSAPGGTRSVALVTLGSAPNARRLLWVSPLVPATAMAEATEAPTPDADPDVAQRPAEPRSEAPTALVPAARVEGFDDAPFVAAHPLAADLWDEDASDAAWAAHAESIAPAPLPPAPEPHAISGEPDDVDASLPLAALSPTATPSDLSSFVTDPPEGPSVAPPVFSTDVMTSAVTSDLGYGEAAESIATTDHPAADEPTTAPPSTTPAEAPGAHASPAVEPLVAAPAIPDESRAIDDTSPEAFVFTAPGHAAKFVWQMDADRRFTMLSPELAEVIGGAVTNLVGRSWSEVAAELGFDGDGRIAEALARRDTWSGRTVLWPVEGEALRVPVDLAALPAFDRGRAFSGFRGFGTARADEPVPDPTGVGLRLRAGGAARPAASAPAAAALESRAADVITTETAATSKVDSHLGITTPIADDLVRPTDTAVHPLEPTPLVEAPVLPEHVEPVAIDPIVTPEVTSSESGPFSRVDTSTVADELAEPASAWPDDIEVVCHETQPDAHGESVGDDGFAGEITPAAAPDIASTAASADTTLEPPHDEAPSVGGRSTTAVRAGGVVTTATEDTVGHTASPSKSTPETAAIAAAVAAYTAAGVPKSGPARVDGDVLPRSASGKIETSASHLVETAEDRRNLSQPERLAFRQIAEALGPREDAETPAPADTATTGGTEAPSHAALSTDAASPVAADPAPIDADGSSVSSNDALLEPMEPSEQDTGSEAHSTRTPRVSPRAALRAGDVGLLDRLPLPVAVIRDDAVIYANERLLTLLRYRDLAELTRAGGLDGLFAGEHVARRWQSSESGRPVPVLAADGTVIPAEINISSVPWGDSSALLMSLVEVAPIPASSPTTPVETPNTAAVEKKPLEAEPTSASETVAAKAAFATAPITSDPVAEPPRSLPVTNVIALPGASQTAPIGRASDEPSRTKESAAAIEPGATTTTAPLGLVRTADAERVAELEAIVDTATDGVLILDADGIVLSANAGAEALFGCARREIIGRPLTDRLAPESRRSANDYLDGLARNGVASVLNDGREVIGAVKPEGLIPLFMTIGGISTAPVKKYCAVLRDITQWKKAEEDLTTARRRAEEASVHKSDFLAKISHEIRTPLNAIIGFSELMMDERFGPVGNDRYKDYLRDIHVSGSHIMSLVNDLLDLSKVEAGKMDLRFEAVALADLVTEGVAMMQPQANRERIIIRSSLPVGVPPVVADPRSIRQVLLNLLSNAIKFTPAGGQVIVSTTLEDNGEVVLRVRDTGYGMTDKEMQAAMEPFRQLHTTRSRSGGTGLGLPLTKALAEANRAAFRIDSTVGHGTLVSITFPVTRVLAS